MAMMRLRREDPRVVGSFRLHRRLGAGGMGVVYLGSDRKGQRVALKVIRPDLAPAPQEFARASHARCRRPGGFAAGAPHGSSQPTSTPIDRGSPPSTCPAPPCTTRSSTRKGTWARPTWSPSGPHCRRGWWRCTRPGWCTGISAPFADILLSPKGPRIIDFGIAWATGASTLTHVGTAVGSPGFLAPEQVRGAAVTPATDVFSLGATLAYASMGDSPFGHGSSEVMLYRVVHEEAQLHGVPDALAPLVRACLAKDPEERPSTLQLSLRLKEIAAREAQGLADMRPPAPRAAEADRPPGGSQTPIRSGRRNDIRRGRRAHRIRRALPAARRCRLAGPGTERQRHAAPRRGPVTWRRRWYARQRRPGVQVRGAAHAVLPERAPVQRRKPPGLARRHGTSGDPGTPGPDDGRRTPPVAAAAGRVRGGHAARGARYRRGAGLPGTVTRARGSLNVVREQRQGKVRVPSDQEATQQGPSQRDDRAAVTAG
ncbi:Serine/threonine-protein kinase PknD [Streptomyces alboniger]